MLISNLQVGPDGGKFQCRRKSLLPLAPTSGRTLSLQLACFEGYNRAILAILDPMCVIPWCRRWELVSKVHWAVRVEGLGREEVRGSWLHLSF